MIFLPTSMSVGLCPPLLIAALIWEYDGVDNFDDGSDTMYS